MKSLSDGEIVSCESELFAGADGTDDGGGVCVAKSFGELALG